MGVMWQWLRRARCGALLGIAMLAAGGAGSEEQRSFQVILPGQEHNLIKTSWPAIGCWFWTAPEFEPEGYKEFLDLHAIHSSFSLLTTSFRYPLEVTSEEARTRVKDAAEYARERGMGLVLDLDVRLARQAFMDRYPDEMQELVILEETPLQEAAAVEARVASVRLGDHYTYRAPSYYTLSSRLLRVYAYHRDEAGILPGTLEDITEGCTVLEQSPAGVRVLIPAQPETPGRTACVMAAMTLFRPDVFAPHLTSFERETIEFYADVPLSGTCKDEWGFPAHFQPNPDELWFSTAMAAAYAARRAGHELVRDILLMSKGEHGREAARAAAINHYQEMKWQRNGEVEAEFYRSTKAVFGEQAMVGTHPTWYPFPGAREAFKNGLHWWVSPRDLAQTDEATPFAARTALAKKWHSPLWFNMYYDATVEPYMEDLWRHALGGGRMNFHPLFPRADDALNASLLGTKLYAADARVRLLNYISTAPIDCPVAVIFGHPRALNWADTGLGDVGLVVTNGLWELGYYADLIPSSEIASGALRLAEDGSIMYGPQRYAAAVLYEPQYERQAIADFFTRAAAGGRTALYAVGAWTADFEGNAFDGSAALPQTMERGDALGVVAAIAAQLQHAGIEPHTPSTMRSVVNFPESMMPRPSGRFRLIDGTVILASGEHDVMGDPIQAQVELAGQIITFDTIGVAAVRLDAAGNLEAMAGGGLKRFEGGGIVIELENRADIALWRDASGTWQGVVQGLAGPLPEALSTITANWTRLRLPTPLPSGPGAGLE